MLKEDHFREIYIKRANIRHHDVEATMFEDAHPEGSSIYEISNVEKNLKTIINENYEREICVDVGCGTGLFCLETSKHGFSVEGIEPSGMLVEMGRKVLNVYLHHGFVEDFDPGYRYNGMVVWDVLEHVHNPVSLLKRCNDLMEDGGYLFVQVPNHDGISNRFKTFLCQKRLKRSDFKHFGFPWHVYSFNKKSLSKLLILCGFSPSLFESWSHRLKEGAEGLFPRLMISMSKRFCLSDYITCVARKLP